LPAIYGVADQLTQVIMNLLINAADALSTSAEDTREIALRSELAGDQVCFSVTDNGGGMDQETLNRAFEAFYTTKSKGTGLGLSLCYSIITGHGGTIEINAAPGQGTQVKIFLPVPTDDGDETL
jgi:two-component system NtrC family sensor kinase